MGNTKEIKLKKYRLIFTDIIDSADRSSPTMSYCEECGGQILTSKEVELSPEKADFIMRHLSLRGNEGRTRIGNEVFANKLILYFG